VTERDYGCVSLFTASIVCYRFWALAVNIGTHPMVAFGERAISAIASFYPCFTFNEQ